MSLSGLNATPRYGCKAPEGITCRSVSGVYANRDLRAMPTQTSPAGGSPPAPLPMATPALLPTASPSDGQLRSSPRILRLWVKPWEDTDGDFVDQSHVYVQIDGGQWLIEHAQRRIRDAHAPVRTVSPTPAAGTPSAGTSDRDPARGSAAAPEPWRLPLAARPTAGATPAFPGVPPGLFPTPAVTPPTRSTSDAKD